MSHSLSLLSRKKEEKESPTHVHGSKTSNQIKIGIGLPLSFLDLRVVYLWPQGEIQRFHTVSD